MIDTGLTWAEQPEPARFLHTIDPEYFALRIRQAVRDYDPTGPGEDPADSLVLEDVAVEDLFSHPAAIEAAEAVLAAETAVLEAEDAGVTDELAMQRLDKARAAERDVLVRLQKARTAAHTARAGSRAAQVLPLRPFRVIEGGAAA
ncbi:hypothetical protein IQ251_14135 [Saccharopolyspora sp. HNM0983]|uniref:Uncharacterized protein n=1 Tax=Saccharopolyspora montiporae TaxID=2781240 RepID=A0A929BDG2_9PSEU|nr:hypothetical protein [Saccharopolyspora sp. HNM0983]MBE9375588.1 hypothetical protein [Saccharopolyspora sp. HNM0983]